MLVDTEYLCFSQTKTSFGLIDTDFCLNIKQYFFVVVFFNCRRHITLIIMILKLNFHYKFLLKCLISFIYYYRRRIYYFLLHSMQVESIEFLTVFNFLFLTMNLHSLRCPKLDFNIFTI